MPDATSENSSLIQLFLSDLPEPSIRSLVLSGAIELPVQDEPRVGEEQAWHMCHAVSLAATEISRRMGHNGA